MRKVFGKGLMQKIEPVFFDFVKLSTFVQEESARREVRSLLEQFA